MAADLPRHIPQKTPSTKDTQQDPAFTPQEELDQAIANSTERFWLWAVSNLRGHVYHGGISKERAAELLKGFNINSAERKLVDSMEERGGSGVGRVIAVANQKGGVGKTTTAVNLGACLAEKNREVLLVDIDPQGNATSGIGLKKSEIKSCIYDVLINETPVTDVVLETQVPKLHMVPATIKLAGAEAELVGMMARDQRLRLALEPIRNTYDYILIDCPPSLGNLTLNALSAADSVIVPIQCEFYALEGLSQLMRTIQLVQKYSNPRLEIEGVVLTMYDSRTNLSQQVTEEVRKYFQNKVYDSIIPRNVRLSEAPSYGLPITLYDGKSKGSEAYMELAKEVAGRD